MKSRCCRSLPRCATCPVLLANRGRVAVSPGGGDPFELLRGAAARELPVCVRDALQTLDERRFARRARD